MKELKIGDVVIAPEGCEDYLTAGREYVVIDVSKKEKDVFCVLADNGTKMYCLLQKCGHLNGKNWIIKNMGELKITKEKVLEAAAKCSTAKEVLSTIFPEIFVQDKSVKVYRELKDNEELICCRLSGEYEEKAFCLEDEYNWEIKRDSRNALCLIPTKK